MYQCLSELSDMHFIVGVEIHTIRVSESLCILIVRSQEYFHNHDTQVTLHNLHNSHVNH